MWRNCAKSKILSFLLVCYHNVDALFWPLYIQGLVFVVAMYQLNILYQTLTVAAAWSSINEIFQMLVLWYSWDVKVISYKTVISYINFPLIWSAPNPTESGHGVEEKESWLQHLQRVEIPSEKHFFTSLWKEDILSWHKREMTQSQKKMQRPCTATAVSGPACCIPNRNCLAPFVPQWFSWQHLF